MVHSLFRKSPAWLSAAGFFTSAIYYFILRLLLNYEMPIMPWIFLTIMLVIAGLIFGISIKKLYYKIYRDPLTGLHNKGYLSVMLGSYKEKISKQRRSLSLIMFDLDNFKVLNDTYGHMEGDKALAKIGDILLKNIRENDSAFRYGGDEFIAILPDTNKDEAVQVAKRIKESIKQTAFTDSSLNLLDASFGVIEVAEGIPIDDMISLVDSELYYSKKSKALINRVL